jgi:hypothetical protein
MAAAAAATAAEGSGSGGIAGIIDLCSGSQSDKEGGERDEGLRADGGHNADEGGEKGGDGTERECAITVRDKDAENPEDGAESIRGPDVGRTDLYS